MTVVQKEFVWNYLIVHVMACEVEEVIGIVDYFSNDMLEIVCFDTKDLQIQWFDWLKFIWFESYI